MKTMINMKTVYPEMTHMIHCALFIILCVLLAPSSTILAQQEVKTDQEAFDAIDEEIKWLQSETYVITPSKIPEKIKKTAASITVVTDKQIRQMGAKHLQDVIKRVVPSFWLTRGVEMVRFHARGQSWSRVLLMVNGLPVYDADYQGTTYFNHNVLNLDNVKRIEVIRGPGSALYGANAYHGVINIITKNAEDVDGIELTARGGSWDTQQYNLLFGKTFSDMEAVFNFNYLKTDGNSAFIKSDAMTWIDQNIYAYEGFPPASMAPGYTNENEEKYDLALNVRYKGFIFDGGYINRQWNHPFDHIQWFLVEKNTWLDETYRLNLGYETTLWNKLDLSAKVYRLLKESTYDNQQWPPGYTDWEYGSYGTIWPEGLNWIEKYNLSRIGMEIQATYKMSESNTIVIGVTYEKQKFYDYEVWANMEYLWDSDELIPISSMQKEAWGIDDQKNKFKALFSEDVWDITEDLRLTLGAHYIDYSTFGSHFSPRAGLTWEYIKGYDIKLLYGHAFSIPAIRDTLLYTLPGTTLGPQTIDSYEISLGAEFTPSFESRITLFQNKDKDLFTWHYWTDSDPRAGWMNLGKERSHGVEVEARYDFGRGIWVAGNYSYTSMSSDDTTMPPRVYLGKIMSNIRLSRYLNLCVDGYYIGGWNKGTRILLESSGRTIVNATLIARNLFKGYEGLELRGSVYNLFDEDWADYIGITATDGWPQPGINYIIELRYKF